MSGSKANSAGVFALTDATPDRRAFARCRCQVNSRVDFLGGARRSRTDQLHKTFSGQSLKGPAGRVAILKLADTAVDEGNDGKPASAAGRAQGIAFAFGKGRVVVMGEAAELSAQIIGTERFGMNVPGLDNRQMALNILHCVSGLLEPRGTLQKKAAQPGRSIARQAPSPDPG